MQSFLHFLATYESFIYLFLGIAFALYLFRAISAMQERRLATFALEQEQAEAKLKNSILGMGLSLLVGIMVFSMVTYVAPSRSKVILPTATANLLSTPEAQEGTPTPINTPTPLPPPKLDTGGCKPDEVEITSPQSGETVQGEVDIIGSAFIPDFGFYKVDIAPASQALFLTIFASHTPVKQGKLVEKWDTTTMPPGDYVLQLIVVDNQGKALPPCRRKVHIAPPKQENR